MIYHIYFEVHFKFALTDLVRFLTIASRHGMAMHEHHLGDREGKS